MRYGHNLQGYRAAYSAPTTTIFTPAQILLIDNAITTPTPAAHAYTGTVSSHRDEHNWATNDPAALIDQGMKLAFGLFLPGFTGLDASQPAPAQSYAGSGSIIFYMPRGASGAGLANLQVFPFFGRCSAPTVTSSTAAPQNGFTNIVIPPHTVSYTDGEVCAINASVDFKNLRVFQSANPMGFGWCIRNMNAAATVNMYYMFASLNFERNSDVLNVMDPVGH